MLIQENVPLAPYTTLGVGGPARWLVEASSETDILDALRLARRQAASFFILGGGSNLLVSDEGFPGVVIHIRDGESSFQAQGNGTVCVTAHAGVDWDALVTRAVERNCAGIECLAGIPGSVGATPVQNVGAYGQEVSQTTTSVRAIDLQTERCVQFSASECGFSYRRSIFNTTSIGRFAIVQVQYSLRVDGKPQIAYRDLNRYFNELGNPHPTLAETADAVRTIRRRKGMVLDEHDPDSRSAGSFFKNPVVSREAVAQLAAIRGCPAEEVPHYPAGAGFGPESVKLSAAWLIELAGFSRGFAMGRAGLSSKHVLAIVNRGGATAADILNLRDAVIGGVQSRIGIRLEQEPVMLGFRPQD